MITARNERNKGRRWRVTVRKGVSAEVTFKLRIEWLKDSPCCASDRDFIRAEGSGEGFQEEMGFGWVKCMAQSFDH